MVNFRLKVDTKFGAGCCSLGVIAQINMGMCQNCPDNFKNNKQ